MPTFPRLRRSASTLRPGAGRTFALTFKLRHTSKLTLTFRNAKGKLERTITVPRHAKGTVIRIRWDGRDSKRRYVAKGRYRFTLTATGTHDGQTAHGSLEIAPVLSGR